LPTLNPLLFDAKYDTLGLVTQPLALVVYENLLPGSQLVNRLQDLNYRVQVIADPALLVECAEQARPMLVLTDLDSNRPSLEAALGRLKQNSATRHLPVIGFTSQSRSEQPPESGLTLIVNDVALLAHLPQFLDQALHVE
jgi:CheY-like chemotaxis protein